MRDKLSRFMYGRYGVDQLGRALLTYALILCIISLFVPGLLSSILYCISIYLIVTMYYRMFSRNIQKRYQENIKYLNIKSSFQTKFHKEREILSQRQYYHFYRCPHCRQRIRIPRGKGRIEIRCPRCSHTFIKKS